jgi:hypothetical protein
MFPFTPRGREPISPRRQSHGPFSIMITSTILRVLFLQASQSHLICTQLGSLTSSRRGAQSPCRSRCGILRNSLLETVLFPEASPGVAPAGLALVAAYIPGVWDWRNVRHHVCARLGNFLQFPYALLNLEESQSNTLMPCRPIHSSVLCWHLALTQFAVGRRRSFRGDVHRQRPLVFRGKELILRCRGGTERVPVQCFDRLPV